MKQHLWDSIVIGGGAAGLSAAQALGRAGRSTLVIDDGEPRNRFAEHLHNVLGHDGRTPAELLARGRSEARSYGVEFSAGTVLSVRDGAGGVAGGKDAGGTSARTLTVELAGSRTLETRALVIATGVTDVLPEIPGLAEHWGRGVLHCPYCHGWEVRGARIAVVPSSPLGLHQARLVRQWTDSLTVFTAALGELDAHTARELAARGVTLEAAPVGAIVSTDVGAHADAAAGSPGAERQLVVRTVDGAEYDVDAIFTMGDMVPRDGFLAELDLDRTTGPMGSFITVDMLGSTSHPRVWAAGNVVNPSAAIPQSMGAGGLAGAAVNAALVDEDFALAAAPESDTRN